MEIGLDNCSCPFFFYLGPGAMVFCYQNCDLKPNCSSDRETILKFETGGGEFGKVLSSLEQFTQTVKGQKKF